MRWLVLVGLVGCYSPTVHPGAQCGPGGACPGELVCSAQNTCEPPADASTRVDAAIDAAVASDAPGVDACTTCGAPANDLPGGAIDVSGGGDYTVDLTNAHDDAMKPAGGGFCGNAGGLDVFYKVTVPNDEVVYLDTFGSDFDTVIRVFHGACVGGAAPLGTVCHDNVPACNASLQTVWLGTMAAGDNCIVIDGQDGTQTGHSLRLRVERGGRNGTRVVPQGVPNAQTYTFADDTTNASNVEDGTCAQHALPDIGYAFSLCPGQTRTVGATTCNATTAMTAWDTAVWARGPGGELACKDDDGATCTAGGGFSTISFSATGNHLFWVIVDGGGGTPKTGAYEVDLNFQ